MNDSIVKNSTVNGITVKNCTVNDNRVPIKYLRNLLRLATAKGVDTDSLCQRAGLPANPLHGESYPAEIEAISYSRLYNLLARDLNDECLGFYRQRNIPPGTFRLLCRIMIACHSLGEALRESDRFLALLGASDSHQSLSLHDDTATLTHPAVDRHEVDPVFMPQNGVAGSLSSWHRLCGWLIARPINLARVDLREPREVDLSKFERIFRCAIHFDSDRDALHFPAHFLDMPIVRGPEQLTAFLKVAPFELVALREVDADRHASLSYQVTRLVEQDFSGRLPTFAEVACQLDTSPRTLRRRLELEQTSYQAIKDNCRQRLATALLDNSRLSIAAVAERLGFEEPSAFHRAFKRWTGVTPGQYRER